MTKRIKKYKKDICLLSKCSPSQRKNILNAADNGLIDAYTDIAKTLLYGNLGNLVPESKRKKLRKNRKKLVSLANKKFSITKRRKLLQQGGSFLGDVWSVVKSLIGI